jgi:hypothetical protein
MIIDGTRNDFTKVSLLTTNSFASPACGGGHRMWLPAAAKDIPLLVAGLSHVENPSDATG